MLERQPALGERLVRRRDERVMHAAGGDDDDEREHEHHDVVAVIVDAQLGEIGARALAEAGQRGGGDLDRIEIVLARCARERRLVLGEGLEDALAREPHGRDGIDNGRIRRRRLLRRLLRRRRKRRRRRIRHGFASGLGLGLGLGLVAHGPLLNGDVG